LSAALWRVAGVPLGRVAPGVVDVPLVRVARLSGCDETRAPR